MSNGTLKSVINQLKSDKLKDRQQGLSSLREVFSRNSVVDNLDPDGDGKSWLVVFQALFTAVLNERSAALKKGGSVAAAERRLKEAASAVRWLTERSVTHWATKVAKPLVKHLLQTMVHGGQLFAPVALDYVKALRVICSYAPHRDHLMMNAGQWMSILSLSFAVVLDDDLKTGLEDEPEVSSEVEVNLVLSENEDSPARKRRKLETQDTGRTTPRPSAPRTVSPEQIEFVALIAILLRSPRMRLVAAEHQSLTGSVLNRLSRFFKLYPVETSAHLDAIGAVQATLESVALNARDEVIKVGINVWDHFIQLWSTKSRSLKEGILMALKTMLPYAAHAEGIQFDKAEGFSKLLRHLLADNGSRWGFEELSLDSLRLEVASIQNEQPFVARTFRAGFNFSATQATSWANLELMADVIKELYLVTESSHSSITESRRSRLENPIKSLLQTILQPRAIRGKSFALQSLLFVIERHWTVLHGEMQLEVIDGLFQMITTDDTRIQSWIFCCLAATAYADSMNPNGPLEPATARWDAIWSHSMRRTNAPSICRAACHTANALLTCGKVPLTRILTEIETMAQDINVQGPTAPYDSVCAFLGRCVRVASQDTRLHRMHLDDKVLSWLIENWNVLSGVSRSASSLAQLRLVQHTIQDILGLLECACGFFDTSQLYCPIPLPRHAIVDLIQTQMDTAAIQEFLLDARFPHTQASSHLQLAQPSNALSSDVRNDLMQPDSRVRKASAFFLKTLEAIIPAWEEAPDIGPRSPAESVRRALDFAVLAICFESSMVMNGVANNRRSLLAACKLISLLAPHLVELSWSTEELVILLSSFAPLSSVGSEDGSSRKWEPFIDPGNATGVRHSPKARVSRHGLTTRHSSRQLQAIIWQSSDVQDALAAVLTSFRKILKTYITEEGKASGKHTSPVLEDEKDGFGPIRTSNAPIIDMTNETGDQSVFKRIICMCVDSIAMAPVLRSSEGQVARDKTLADVVCSSASVEKFQVIIEPFLLHVRQENIRPTPSNIDALLTYIEEPLLSYNYGCSDDLHSTVIQLLDATAHIWLQRSFPAETASKVRTVIAWLANNLRNETLCWWRTRDALCRFFDHYLSLDPLRLFLTDQTDGDALDTENLPDSLLPFMSKDEDIRVRFTAALSCARLFSTPYIRTKDQMQVYTVIREQLCRELDNYEHMLTRFLCLADIMIASSAVRRGPYWHLLEVCLHSEIYVKHVESVLRVAAEKMGLDRFSELFQSYATQIAYSVRLSGKDFFFLPPHLLGYRDRQECTEATFTAFSPTNLLAGLRDGDDLIQGRGPFAHHCDMLGIAPIDGLLKCFADVVGYYIVFWVDDHQVPGSDEPPFGAGVVNVGLSELSRDLPMVFASLGSPEFLRQLVAQNIDGIVCAILRTNGDMDLNRDGAIVKVFENLNKPDRSIRAFRTLTQFQDQVGFDTHAPNLPAFSASIVLLALDWLCEQVEAANSAASTYHVMQYFFAAIAQCPLVNEQLRLLTCLCIWISLAYTHFKSVTLLRVLMSGSAALLAQPELSAIAQGMLGWAFIHLRELQRDTPHVVEILIRISSISREFMESDDEFTRKTGARLKTWIETEVVSLAQVDCLRKRISVSLAAWPIELSESLVAVRGELGFAELSAVLDDPYLSYHKFKIVRHLPALAKSSSYDKDQFARHDFWRLKDSIPLSDMAAEELDAFNSLLITNSGHIRSQAVDQLYGRSVGTRQVKLSVQKATSSTKRPIVQALVELLTDQSARVVHVAYRTLRQLAGSESLDSAEYGSWPPEFRGDITYLDFCPSKEVGQASKNLSAIHEARFIDLGAEFTQWISEISAFLASVLSASDRFYAHLTDVLKDNSDFSAQVFPVLVHTLLLNGQRQSNSASESEVKAVLSSYLTKLLSQAKLDVQCHLSVINLILHLRQFDSGVAGDELAYNRWLDLDFMLLSRSAIKCGAYTTALLFLELAAEYKQAPDADDKSTEQILFDIYSHIDEPDGFYGIKTLDLQDFLVRRFHHERQWDKAFQFHGATFEAESVNPRGSGGIVESLHSFGFNKLAMSTLQTMEASSTFCHSTDMAYSLGWRTGTWDLPDPTGSGNSGATLYVALRAIHRERDPDAIDKILSKSLSDELHRLRTLGNENLIQIREVTKNLMCLAQIRQWRSAPIQNSLVTHSVSVENGPWKEFCAIQDDVDFSDMESIVATRISLLRSARMKDQKEQIGTMQSDLTRALLRLERSCLMRLSEAAREANQPQLALNSILSALQLDGDPGCEVRQEFANVLWLQREQKFAVDCLKSEIQHRKADTSHRDSDPMKVQNALALAKLGEWTSEACLEKPSFIHSQYFLPAIDLLVGGRKENLSLSEVRAAVFYKCALFAEQQYQLLMASEEIKRLQVYQERKTQEIAERKEAIVRAPTRKLQQELSGHQKKAEALYAQDTAQLNEFIGARENFLRQAIEMLSLCLRASDSFDIDAVIRLCSLWFANFKGDASIVQGNITRIPSRKFVFLAHQLSARLSVSDSTNTANQNVLQSLLLRMCSEHPFHSLYQVFSLQSSRSDASSSNRRRSSVILSENSQTDRADAAYGIFERLLSNPESLNRTRDVRNLCNAYLEWAKYPIKDDPAIKAKKTRTDKAGKLLIPKNLAILRIRDLRVPVTTANTPLDPSMRYSDCVWISSYQENFDVAGGINLPKICYCIGSDGVKYKQLFKGEGNDDLRQDAVMEQVFELCNQVLNRDRQTRKRELSIRSYKVIPLAAQAGLLEFVGNTRPLQFLVPAHEKYNKSDLTARECYKRMSDRRATTERGSGGAVLKSALVKEFTEIRQLFRPVMRHFFTECRKEPQAWFEMRLKYSRSVAVTSIVGHILGLGDRHLSNILIDTVTGEVVHIDLGIAFEQGKLLPIPERVPFRLTADIVDGFGMSGTDGVFRRCAEETLRVLRDGSSVIKTVLEVFKHDPLHSWTMSAMKIRKAQAGPSNNNESDRPGSGIGIDLNSGVEDESADRALSSVAKKLDKSLSVEYTVNELIAEATDVTNLALMFVGWNPYC
ncbi:uncharacterized protein FOMMEDRAFT_100399 [Fomitiporia mediterranea MF3/22]|uniref:uncharacterized protein n=1 Tax=Fomitiporia mediterranea (strain MF3/22) TaxID=694068 RepID=UPI0004407A56|nr:uncharacterized protein FOMMEDRAFT_100399 [Fomitiporia mediterranea MF3/22]EJD07243.1 hypothetical protein FOMMEDRAFT_100399 [Fomitiporia mediterranea MF3/22]